MYILIVPLKRFQIEKIELIRRTKINYLLYYEERTAEKKKTTEIKYLGVSTAIVILLNSQSSQVRYGCSQYKLLFIVYTWSRQSAHRHTAKITKNWNFKVQNPMCNILQFQIEYQQRKTK